MNKKFVATALALATLSSLPSAQELGPGVFATVNGKEIKEDLFRAIVGENEVTAEQFEQIANRLISSTVIAQAATEQGLADDPSIQVEIEWTNQQILARAYIQEFLAANQIDDAQVEAKYEELKQGLAQGLEYLSSHILVATEEEAVQAIEDIGNDPEKFAMVAAERSIDKGSAAQGGGLGWATAQTYVPEFKSALESMETGQISEVPVQSQFGWHVIHVLDSRQVEVPPLDEARSQQIREQLQAELITAEVDRLIEAADIEINESLKSSN